MDRRFRPAMPLLMLISLLGIGLLVAPMASGVFYADSIEALGYNGTFTGLFIGGKSTDNYLSTSPTGSGNATLYIGSARIVTEGQAFNPAGGWDDTGTTVTLETLTDDVNAGSFFIDNTGDDIALGTSTTALNGTESNFFINAGADEYGIIIEKLFDSPDEPAALLITGDADGTDDVAIEVRGQGSGPNVHNPTWGAGASSGHSNFVVFMDGTTVIGKTNVGDGYSTPNSAVLELGGNMYTSGDAYIAGANLILGSTDLSETDLDALDDGTIALGTETTGTYDSDPSDDVTDSDITTTTVSSNGNFAPDSSLSAVNGYNVGAFGQLSAHGAYSDFNAEPSHWGWTYVQGTTNSPHSGSQGGYRARIGLGSQYSTYGMELLIPRATSGGNGQGYLFMRQMEGGSFGGWSKINAGFADSAGDLSCTDCIGPTEITDSYVLNTGDSMSGTLALNIADALSFESDKHWITYNDGQGNFNIRVGHYANSSNQEEVTEAGYPSHMEWSQTSGWWQLNIDSTSRSVGDTASWGNTLQFDRTGLLTVNGNTVWHAGNDGSSSTLDADTLDGIDSGSFLRSNVGDVYDPGSGAQLTVHMDSTDVIDTASGSQGTLEIYQPTAGNDAFIEFHVGGDYAAYLGLDGGTNDLAFGGWSEGAVSQRVWHEGNDGSGSGLDADTVDGVQPLTSEADTLATVTGRGATTTTPIAVNPSSGNAISITNAAPQMHFNDNTAGADDFWIHVNGNNFYILPDRADDGSWETPYALQLEADTNIGYLFGSQILTSASTINAHACSADSTCEVQNYITGTFGTIARSTDEWLRLNQNSAGSADHTNGIYTPGVLRADGGLRFNSGNTIDDVTGQYGSMQINGGGSNNWEGLSIDGRVVFMHDGGSAAGIYNDVSNEWMFYGILDGETRMYHNGVNRFYTTTSGVSLRNGNGVHDAIHRVGGIYFTWDSDTYGTNDHHSIRSTNGDSWTDALTINSFGHVRINIDSNNNGGDEVFSVGSHTTGVDATPHFEIYESGNIIMTIG